MAMFKYFIKKHRPVLLSTALGVTIASSIALSMSVGQVFAKDHFASATRMPTGFDPYLTSIHQIQTGAADDADVRLKGRLTGYLYDNNYEFTDEFGQSIEVELDDDTDWSYVHKDQLIEILGEVERNMFKVKVEARYYRILEEVQSSMQTQSSDVAATTVAMSDDPSSQDMNSSETNNVSALSAMTSDDASADNQDRSTENLSAATDDAQNKAVSDKDVAAEGDSSPSLAAMSTASVSDTNTTKNKQVLDKVVVSSTTTTVKTVTVSDNSSAAADSKQADSAVEKKEAVTSAKSN